MVFGRIGGEVLARRGIPSWAGRLSLAMALVLAVAVTWVGAPTVAAAESNCQRYCSGPHKNYEECMERCISREQDDRGRRESNRSIRDLCSARGHDEESCLRDHGYFEDRRRW